MVPVFNVEGYLTECLDSLLAQTFGDFEAIVVIDGATDGSERIARRFARRDRRLHLVRQRNRGLGAARNAGIRHARGEYLAFLDSDDTLPPNAYADMMNTIERTGSDLVVGKLERGSPEHRHTMPLMRRNHRRRREAVTLADMPLILADVFPVNKIFRRSFWARARLEFPVGLRYEDQPTLTRSFARADRFDVIPETVYHWRVRSDGSSITQRRYELSDLADRIASKRISTEIVSSLRLASAAEVWFREILPVDMWEYFRAVPGCSEDYWALLCSAIGEFWSQHTMPFHRTSVPVQQRLMGWLVAQNRRHDLEHLIGFIDQRRGDIPLVVREDRVEAMLPGAGDPGAPESVYVLGEHERRWEGRLAGAAWQGGQLCLEGFALMHNVPTRGAATELTGRLVEVTPEGWEGRSWPLPVLAVFHPRVSDAVGRSSQGYDECGFTCTVDVGSLLRAHPDVAAWRVVLERRVEGVYGSGSITHVEPDRVDRSWQEVPVGEGPPRLVRLHPVEDHLLLQAPPQAAVDPQVVERPAGVEQQRVVELVETTPSTGG